MAKRKIEIKFQTCPACHACEQLGISYSSLKRWRLKGLITEGIHWQYRPDTKARILYNLDLLRDWVANGSSPAHQRAIERYIASLPSSHAA